MASLKQLLEREPPERILVVRSDRVGDLLLSTPFLTVLRREFPKAHITARVAPYCAQVLEGTGLVDALRTTPIRPAPSELEGKVSQSLAGPERAAARVASQPIRRVADTVNKVAPPAGQGLERIKDGVEKHLASRVRRLSRVLRNRMPLLETTHRPREPEESFDLAISLAPRTESLREVLASGAPLRLGYVYSGRPLVRLGSRRYLTHREVVVVNPPHQVAHEVEHLDILARRLGMPSTLNEPLKVGLDKPEVVQDRVVVHLGDRWFTSGWTVEDVFELVQRLSQDYQVLVTAGPREKALLASHRQIWEKAELLSELSFQEWAQTIGSARCLVSPDTGAVHLAAAMQTPVVVAYEAATFAHCSQQWAPWKVPYRTLVKGRPQETQVAVGAAVAQLLG